MPDVSPNRLRRRLLVLSLGSAGLSIVAAQPAQAVSDSDPRDPAGRGGYRYRPDERR